jgi:ATP-dependent exoDNAse (exonuclease V) beta subunit
MSFTVYRSSAGSGKTFTLVKEYLKIILQDTDSFRNILAVTFTNKAAAEMKHRVLRYLEELANPPIPLSEHLLAALINDTGLSETEIRFKAAGALKKILHHYSDFAIGTIDSFSHRIIRAFAHDFGLPVNFEVELDSDKLIETAVDLLLDKVGDDEPLTALLVNFLESKMEDDKSWAIDKTLVNFSRLLLDEESQQHLLKLRALSADDFKTIALFLRKKIRDFGKSVSDEASVARNVIREAGLGHQAFANGRYGISWYFEQIASGRYDKIIPSSKISGMVSKDSWHSNKATSAEKSAIESIRPVLLETYEKLQSLIATSYPAYTLYTLLETSIYPLAVLNSIDRIMQEFKKQNNIIHISEFNSRIASIVLFEPVPFIYERIGEKYHHVLIDEFQDTSALQWQNFVPLIENSLASGYFNLVVGDGKQAIYRWRNGDVEQFTALPALKGSNENPVIRDREEALDRNFQEELLNRNFRSKQEIVSFNNDFFGFIIGFLDESLAKVYAGLTQEADSAKEGGYIRISFIDKGDEEAVAAEE